eukprot:scaffold6494_cov72-Skeletonema_dohrnii-CCMP3373.AAC.1
MAPYSLSASSGESVLCWYPTCARPLPPLRLRAGATLLPKDFFEFRGAQQPQPHTKNHGEDGMSVRSQGNRR